MTTIAVDQAVREVRDILNRVAQGEEFTITDQGAPIARVLPAANPEKAGKPMTLEELRKFREGITLGPDLTIRQLVEEGRKY